MVAAVWSVAFAALFSVQLNRFLRHRSPSNDRALALTLNRWVGRETPAIDGAVKPSGEVGKGRLLRLRLELPTNRVGYREPLLVTGRTGRGDVLFIEYVDAQSVRFGLDHWGAPGVFSETIAIDFSQAVELEIGLPSLATPADIAFAKEVQRGRVFVKVNGALRWAQTIEYFTVEAGEVAVGRNTIGATSGGAEFTGKIVSAVRAER